AERLLLRGRELLALGLLSGDLAACSAASCHVYMSCRQVVPELCLLLLALAVDPAEVGASDRPPAARVAPPVERRAPSRLGVASDLESTMLNRSHEGSPVSDSSGYFASASITMRPEASSQTFAFDRLFRLGEVTVTPPPPGPP